MSRDFLSEQARLSSGKDPIYFVDRRNSLLHQTEVVLGGEKLARGLFDTLFSYLYEWTQGLRLLARLSGHNPNLIVAELGLREAMA